MNQQFKIRDLVALKYFLGLEIARSKQGIHICQRKYALDILSDTGMLAYKPAITPMTKESRSQKEGGSPLDDPGAYRRLIGRLPTSACGGYWSQQTYLHLVQMVS